MTFNEEMISQFVALNILAQRQLVRDARRSTDPEAFLDTERRELATTLREATLAFSGCDEAEIRGRAAAVIDGILDGISAARN